MKIIKTIILFLTLTFTLKVSASACSYKEQTILNNDFSNMKITYEIIDDNEINILIYNLTRNLYLTFVNQDNKVEQKIYYSDTTNGKYIIKRDASKLEEYEFKVRSNLSNCYGKILTTKKIIKPKYNEFYTLEICNNEKLVNHSYCQKFITKNINKTESEVKKTLEDFLKVHVDVITTKKPIEENQSIKEIIKYSLIFLIAVGVVAVLLLIKKKRGEL